MSIKSTKDQRAKERILRTIWQNVFTRIREKNFTYVLQRGSPEKICFGSSVTRECLPIKGPAKSPLMRRLVSDNLNCPDPTTYTFKSFLLKRYPNQQGYSGLAYRSQRQLVTTGKIPPIGTYNLIPETHFEQCKRPFNLGAKLKRRESMITPAPGTYHFRKRNNKIPLNSSVVKTICTPVNVAQCAVCDEIPLGDYWQHLTNKQDMCRACMQKEKQMAIKIRSKSKKLKRLSDLDQFTRVRHCGFYHQHSGTEAAIRIASERYLKIKFRTENYLNMFYY